MKIVSDNRLATETGFILLEIMVSVSIIAIVFMALFRMQSSTIDLAGTGKFNTIAPFLAQMRLSMIEADLENQSDVKGDFGDAFKGIQWQVSILEIPSEDLGFEMEKSEQTLKKIDLVISTTDGNRRYNLTTWRYVENYE